MARDDENSERRPFLQGWLEDIADCIAFFTRLPGFQDPGHDGTPPDMTEASRAAPLAGLVVGLVGVIALGLGHLIGFTAFITAAFAVAVTILVTGALHEDGLSDTADGLGGGWTAKARLEIMRDSRVGTYGVLALGLSLLARIGAVAGIMERGGLLTAMLILLTAETVSRTASIWVIWRLPPARRSGVSADAGRPGESAALQGFILAGLAAFLFMATPAGVLATAFALASAALATLAIIAVARRGIGGQTGDIAGAAQQAALVAFLVAALAALPQ